MRLLTPGRYCSRQVLPCSGTKVTSSIKMPIISAPADPLAKLTQASAVLRVIIPQPLNGAGEKIPPSRLFHICLLQK